MRASPLVRSLLALVLACSFLTVRIGSVSHFAFTEPIQNYLSKKAFFQEDQPRGKSVYYKTKRLAVDNWPWETAEFTFLLPAAGDLQPLHPFQALPEVYPEIFDPPDNLS